MIPKRKEIQRLFHFNCTALDHLAAGGYYKSAIFDSDLAVEFSTVSDHTKPLHRST